MVTIGLRGRRSRITPFSKIPIAVGSVQFFGNGKCDKREAHAHEDHFTVVDLTGSGGNHDFAGSERIRHKIRHVIRNTSAGRDRDRDYENP